MAAPAPRPRRCTAHACRRTARDTSPRRIWRPPAPGPPGASLRWFVRKAAFAFSSEQTALAHGRYRTAHRAARAAGDRADLAVVEFELQCRPGPDLHRVGDDALGGVAHHDIAARQEALVTLGMGREAAGEIVGGVAFRGQRAGHRGGEPPLDIA